ncbi:pancreatic triacylglycerol lipase [Galendromus occidentalis]|uniref:Pancreatic triacylglycerol lipase n=1 Tax=Galendromus occidentalis TaxID=34638 RepID=A0AAJ6QN55_9ACAR|nr:pancreatic triacylglycerol lipase [Galendromus occidentalis]
MTFFAAMLPSGHMTLSVGLVAPLMICFSIEPVSAGIDSFCPELQLNSGKPLDVGCFESSLLVQPELPEQINASYALYLNGNSSVPYRIWFYNESFDNEADTLLRSRSSVAFILHGFAADADARWVQNLTDALMLRRNFRETNVITVDWKSGAEGPNYAQAAQNVNMLGRITAEFIHRLSSKYRLDFRRIHLIGHSLGGQAAGKIMDWLFTRHQAKVGRTTGLDVAAPRFEGNNVWPDKAHCDFLEVIHTSSGNDPVRGSLGLQDNFGHVDLYPNGGVVPQPGCPPPPLSLSCSHSKAQLYYIDLVLNCARDCRYVGFSCNDVTDATNSNCTGEARNICEYLESLRASATEDMEEILYIDTTAQDAPDRCSSNFRREQSFFAKLLGRIVNSMKPLFG